MSTTRPLWWLPESLAAQVAGDLAALLGEAADHWGLPAAATPSAAACANAPSAAAAPDLRTALPKPWRDAAARALFNHPDHGSAILRGVLDRIEQDLHQRLSTRFGGAQPLTAVHAGHAGVLVQLEWLGQAFELPLSNEQLCTGGWLTRPASRAPLGKLTLEAALCNVPVPLTASVGSVDIQVNELLQLAPGDVLLLAEPLDAPLRVRSPGSTLALNALLGSASAHPSPRRALQWLAA